MSALLITTTDEGWTIEELPALPARATTKRKVSKSYACPKCGEDKDVRHKLYSRWHECKICRHSYTAECSKHRHGGSF